MQLSLNYEVFIYGTNHPQLKRPTRVTRVSHACDTHRANAKTRVA